MGWHIWQSHGVSGIYLQAICLVGDANKTEVVLGKSMPEGHPSLIASRSRGPLALYTNHISH